MRVLFLTNNAVSEPLARWLSLDNDLILQSDPVTSLRIAEVEPDIVISYSYRHLVRADTLNMMPDRFVNLHISYLPFNRGADPNFWSLVEGTPSGVTIHIMSEGMDQGDVLAQREVEIVETEHTLKSSYDLLQSEIQLLFRDRWQAMASGSVRPVAQPPGGTLHYAREFASIRDAVLGHEGWNVPVATLRRRYSDLRAKQPVR